MQHSHEVAQNTNSKNVPEIENQTHTVPAV